MQFQTESNRAWKRFLVGGGAGVLMAGALLLAMPVKAHAICEAADLKLAQTGVGDRDHDGLSNCDERFVLGTDPKNFDSDGDSVSDATEVESGTDPLDADSDQDGVDDGSEQAIGTDPVNPDSDNDGVADGSDADPAHELTSGIEGNATSLVCPDGGSDGSLSILCGDVVVTGATEFDGVADCASAAAAIAANGGAHARVEIVDDATCGPKVASKIYIDDRDGDGSPDNVDQDDDGNGVSDSADDNGGSGSSGGGSGSDGGSTPN